MFRFISRNLTYYLIPNRTKQSINNNSARLLQTLALESNDPNTADSKNQHFTTISYLKNKCGLSLDSAVSASKRVTITSTHDADSVLHLLNSYNFTQPQITHLLTRCPSLIQSDSANTLRPKLEFFESLGLSKPDIARIFSSDKYPSFIRFDRDKIERNVSTLREHGMPDANIAKLIITRPKAFLIKNDVFRDRLVRVERMGLCSKSLAFLRATDVVISTSEVLWGKKVELFESFGWSYDEIIAAFKIQPRFIVCSEKKIRVLMDFYLNKLSMEASYVAKWPNLLTLSLEKKLIPRCSVLHILLSKGLISEWNSGSALCANKTLFEKMYVNKYREIVPEMMSFYRGEEKLPSFDALKRRR